MEFAVYTWYMRSEHSYQMQTYGTADVLVPYFADTNYLPLYVATFTPYITYKCDVKFPRKNFKSIKKDQPLYHSAKHEQVSGLRDFRRSMLKVPTAINNSGEYTVRCRPRAKDGHYLGPWMTRILNITFFRGTFV